MDTNADQSQFYIRKPPAQNKFFNTENLGKENIEPERKMPNFNVVGKTGDLPIKGRKHSESSFDRPLRPKGLQDSETSIGQTTIPKKRNHSTGELVGSKTFPKMRFSIFDDAIDFKSNEPERTRLKLRLREHDRLNTTSIPKAKGNDRKCIPRRTTTERPTVVSPKVLPATNKEPSKIKENHKKSILQKKEPRMVVDLLSLELAYNFDYMLEYVRFQMEIYEKKKLSSTFLTKNLTANQRRLVVKYLTDSATYHRYPSFILYQAVKIFDAYIDAVEVNLEDLQTVALAALWISLKKDFISDEIPEAATIIELAGSVFQGNKQPLLESEKKILRALNFDISFPEPFSLLALYTVMIEEVREFPAKKVQEIYYCGSYLIDLSLLLEEMCHTPPIHLAVVCAEIALVLVMTSDENLKNPDWDYWRSRLFVSNPSIEKFCISEAKLNLIRNQLLENVMKSEKRGTDFYIIFKKYNTKRYGPVSKFIISKISSIELQNISNLFLHD